MRRVNRGLGGRHASRLFSFGGCGCALGWSARWRSDRAQAEILITVNKSAQRMTVMVDGRRATAGRFPPASTAARRPAPIRPQRLERMWHSRNYDWSPMPHAIFFHHGFAIHGTNYVSRLGRRASHGCVRLHPSNAATLFALVKSRGMGTHHHRGFRSRRRGWRIGSARLMHVIWACLDFTNAPAARNASSVKQRAGSPFMLRRVSASLTVGRGTDGGVGGARSGRRRRGRHQHQQGRAKHVGAGRRRRDLQLGRFDRVGGGPYDGTYRPGRMERKWASRKYNMAPMPYSIFFDGNYAIHGTSRSAARPPRLQGLRAPASAGRRDPVRAGAAREGNTTIVVHQVDACRGAHRGRSRAMRRAVEAKAEPPARQNREPGSRQPKPQLAKPASIYFTGASRRADPQACQPQVIAADGRGGVLLPLRQKYGLAH